MPGYDDHYDISHAGHSDATKRLLPVLLGSDANAYGMARSFYLEYGIKSVCICKQHLAATHHTSLIETCIVEPDFENDEVFVKTLVDFAEAHENRILLLVSCADGYSILLARHMEQLGGHYLFAAPSAQTVESLGSKRGFYKSCEQFGLSYPKTMFCTKENYQELTLPFDSPFIIKASNSMEYRNCDFPGKKKAYLAHGKDEYLKIAASIYSSSYQDELVLQEYIPGDDWCSRTLNCYCGLDGKVHLMALGRTLIEDQTPDGIGNYLAIISDFNEELTKTAKSFLEHVGWVGFCNLDIKYDARNGKYRFFELNPRQGLSSFFVTQSGFNLAKWLVEDVVEHRKQQFTVANKEILWLTAPFILLRKYLEDECLLERARKLKRSGKSAHQLLCSGDLNLKRLIWFLGNQIHCYRLTSRYFGKRWDS